MSVCVADAQTQLFRHRAVLHKRRPQGSLQAGCGSIQPRLQAPELGQQGRPSQQLRQLHIRWPGLGFLTNLHKQGQGWLFCTCGCLAASSAA